MEHSVRDWLIEKVRKEAQLSTASAIGVYATGALVSVGMFFVFYALLWLLTWIVGQGSPAHWLVLTLLSLLLVGLLFLLNAITDEQYVRRAEARHGLPGKVIAPLGRAVAYSSQARYSGPELLHSALRAAGTVLLVGPRIVMTGARLQRRAKRLEQLDTRVAGAILERLYNADARVAYTTLQKDFPDLNPAGIRRLLRDIDGVILLESEPPGVTLTPLLMAEIEQYRQEHRRGGHVSR